MKLKKSAYAEAYSYRITRLKSAVENLKGKLGFTDTDDDSIASKINTIMWITYLRLQASDKMIFGTDTPEILKD